MIDLISFLDDHSGSLTFLVTFVYVVATIFICVANLKSAKASNKQLEESTRQFEEEHRAYISAELVFKKCAIYGIRFCNYGKRIANHVHIQFNQKFIDSAEEPYAKSLRVLKDKECVLGIGQSYDVYFGTSGFLLRKDLVPIEVSLTYEDFMQTYEEKICIDITNYAPVFPVDGELDDLIKAMGKHTKEITSAIKENNHA